MSRQLEEYRRMRAELVVAGEHDFPNCSKYKSIYGACCDKTWKKNLENIKGVPKPTMKPQGYIREHKPEGFDGF